MFMILSAMFCSIKEIMCSIWKPERGVVYNIRVRLRLWIILLLYPMVLCDYNLCSNRFTYLIAFLLLLTGAALNDQRGEESLYFGTYYCYVVKPGVFAGGAMLSLASVAFGIIYYITIMEGKNASNAFGNSSNPNQGNIAMGQPQIPTQTSQDPVFVHEDTYVRRQFTWLMNNYLSLKAQCCVTQFLRLEIWRLL